MNKTLDCWEASIGTLGSFPRALSEESKPIPDPCLPPPTRQAWCNINRDKTLLCQELFLVYPNFMQDINSKNNSKNITKTVFYLQLNQVFTLPTPHFLSE